MVTETKPWTRDELARLPNDGNRYEVLDGELLVTPQAEIRHQDIAWKLGFVLREYVQRIAAGTVVGPGAVVFLQNELQPDVQVIPVAGPFPLGTKWEDVPGPILVVEILSPGSHRHDLIKKRDAYLRLGIPEYWAVDHEARKMLVFTPGSAGPRIEESVLNWTPKPGVESLSIDLRELLA